jgi:hypothetical protein
MRRFIVAASLLTALAAGRAAGEEFRIPQTRDAAYVEIDSGMMTVIADKTAVTAAPDAKSKVVGLLKNGEQVIVYGTGEKWVHIHSKSSNIDGYVQKSMLQ